MVAVVVAAEILAKTICKRQLAQNRALETILDIASAAVVALACYVFARYFYPGSP
jgi:hypothetical protein